MLSKDQRVLKYLHQKSLKLSIRPQDLITNTQGGIRDASEWLSNKSEVARNWGEDRMEAFQNWLEEQTLDIWMERPYNPLLQTINPFNYRGDYVVFVNGVFNSLADATTNAKYLSFHLKRPILLLYNPTEYPLDLVEALWDKSWMFPMPQHNITTKMLCYLMYHATGKMSLVTHSQGCLIAQNALITMQLLGKNWFVQNLAWVAAAPPTSDNMPKPYKYTPLIKAHDPVPAVLGIKGGYQWYKMNFHKHSFVRMDDSRVDMRSGSGGQTRARDTITGEPVPGRSPNDYLDMIEAEMLYATVGSTNVNTTRHFRKFVRVSNLTDEKVSVKGEFRHHYGLDILNSDPWREFESIEIDPNNNALLRWDGFVHAARVRLRAESFSHSWNRWSDEIEIVPREGYELPAGQRSSTYIIELSPETASNNPWYCYGKTAKQPTK